MASIATESYDVITRDVIGLLNIGAGAHRMLNDARGFGICGPLTTCEEGELERWFFIEVTTFSWRYLENQGRVLGTIIIY